MFPFTAIPFDFQGLSRGQWNLNQVIDIPPTTWNAYLEVYDLAADRGRVYLAGASYYTDCEDPPCFSSNDLYRGDGASIPLGQDFGPTGPMASDKHGNLYGATPGCGQYLKGLIWKAPHF